MFLRKLFFLIPFSFVAVVVSAQPQPESINGNPFCIAGGLGITLVNAPDIADYLNTISISTSRVDDFATASEFYGTFEVIPEESWGMKLEYAYLLKSYSVADQSVGNYVFSYGIHMPSAVVHRLVRDRNVVFKFGGGLGYHVSNLQQEYSFGTKRYRSTGIGAKAELEVNTAFGDNLYSYIVIDARKNFMSAFKDSEGHSLLIAADGSTRPAFMNFFSLGLKFGLIIYF